MAEENQTQNPEAQPIQQPGPILTTRRQRRWMMRQQGVLKYISNLPFSERSKIRQANIENGRKLHQQHLDAIEKQQHTALERKLEGYTNEEGEYTPGLKDSWKEQGYNAEEINKLEEAWALGVIKDKENYRANRKKAKQLNQEARASLADRNK